MGFWDLELGVIRWMRVWGGSVSCHLGSGLGGVRGSGGDLVLDAGVPVFDGGEELVGLSLAVVERGDHANVLGHLEDLVLMRFRLRVR